jgi:TetR/AcrR family transcriptional regulator, transcriptional repressor for nem operon
VTRTIMDRLVQVNSICARMEACRRNHARKMPDIKHFDVDATVEIVVELFWRNGLAATGIRDITEGTGLNRSSLYATFGNKQSLYERALRRYIETWSAPTFRHLVDSQSGLLAITDFFDGLIELRCRGPFTGWGCMVTNAHAGVESSDPAVRAILNEHHEQLRDALFAALQTAAGHKQLAVGTDIHASAELLTSLVYTVNLRSRSYADTPKLRRVVAHALASMTDGRA